MHIQFYEANHLWNYFCRYLGGETKERMISKAEKIIETLLNDANSIDQLIEMRKQLSAPEFVNILENVAAIEITEKDLIRIFSKLTNHEYQLYLIDTTTKYELLIIANETFKYQNNHRYSLEEINNLIENNQIIILEEYETECEEQEINSTFEPLFQGTCLGTLTGINRIFTEKDGIYYQAIIKEIKKYTRNSHIKAELEYFILNICRGINIMEENTLVNQCQSNQDNAKLISECKDNFDAKGYTRRLEQLKEKYPNYIHSTIERSGYGYNKNI